ncbi:helix-turn-helix domain-containing protein [Variovorax sp. 2RAF20]
MLKQLNKPYKHLSLRLSRLFCYSNTSNRYLSAVDKKCQTGNSWWMGQPQPRTQSARQRVAFHLRVIRAERRISQEQLAEAAGLHRTFVGSVEREERNISLDNLERLAYALDVDVSLLVSPVVSRL